MTSGGHLEAWLIAPCMHTLALQFTGSAMPPNVYLTSFYVGVLPGPGNEASTMYITILVPTTQPYPLQLLGMEYTRCFHTLSPKQLVLSGSRQHMQQMSEKLLHQHFYICCAHCSEFNNMVIEGDLNNQHTFWTLCTMQNCHSTLKV